ncbi:glycosyltransferase [Chloroflexota bacterium]
MIWYDYPSIYSGGTLPAFNILKHLSKKNEITLLCFRQVTGRAGGCDDLEQYCEAIETVDLHMPKSRLGQILGAIRNTFSPQNLLANNRSFFTLCYSAEMLRKFRILMREKEFDLIYTVSEVAYISRHTDKLKIIHKADCFTKSYYDRYKNTKNLILKFYRWLIYLREKKNESMICENFDACVAVTNQEKVELASLFPKADIRVIPNGVDCEYYKPLSMEKEFPSLGFVGSMSDLPNIEAVLYFYRYIYGRIKEEIPDIRFYIIGQKPVGEIRKLADDETVIVTGYVEDVRPYLASTSVVVIPMVSGRGIKNKVLEAMAMGKAVVTTTIGARGIAIASRKNIMIADEPELFAQQVTEVLKNQQLRETIGFNARELVETQYSWAETTNRLNELISEKFLKHQRV